MNKIIIELLLKIHLYYPIGMPQLNTDYPGYKLFNDKIEHKIREIESNTKTPWTSFLKEAEAKAENFKVYDYSASQFPSYSCEFELEIRNEGQIKIRRTVFVNVSLLANCYTICFLDNYRCFNYNPDSSGNKQFFQYEIAYSRANKNKLEQELIESLKKIIEKFFSGYLFLEHHFLLTTEIQGGCPRNKLDEYLAYPEKKYSFYEYLFSDDILRSKIFILE